MSQLILTIDWSKVHDFRTFIHEFNRVYSRFGVLWHGNLDAFNDYLVWPDEKYVLIWRDSYLSRERLGYEEMVKWLEERVQNCHPSNVPHMQERLEAAKLEEGQTMFDLLVEIIEENSDYLQLRLE
jgi:hypothetical protein